MIRLRPLSLLSVTLIALGAAPTWGHELWFQPAPAGAGVPVRLTFGDSPTPGEAERVAEIAHAQVWADGRPLEVGRLADGLEVHLPEPRPAVCAAFADRGIVPYQGDSLVITLAAYAQSHPVERVDGLRLGVDEEQVRLLLVAAADGGSPVVRAIWRGKPVSGVAIKVFRGTTESTEVRTNEAGEIPCPDRKSGAVSLLVQVVDRTPGHWEGKPYSEHRYKATLMLSAN